MSERILELERQVNELRRQVEFLQNRDDPGMRMSLRTRIARTFDNGAYPPESTAAGIIYPIVFQDGGENDRQATSQKNAKNLASGYLQPSTKIVVTEVDGNWFTAIGSAQPPDSSGVKLAKITSAVSARSGDTPGTGIATVWQFSNGALVATAETLTVYNLQEFNVAVDSARFVWLVQETASSRWMVISPYWSEVEGVSPGGGQVIVPFYIGDKLKFTSPGEKPVVDKQVLNTVTVTLPESSTIIRKAFTTQDIDAAGTGPIVVLEPELVVLNVTKAVIAEVVTAVAHGYQTGDTVRIFPDYSKTLLDGMFQLSSWIDYVITVVNATTFTIPVNTTSFNDWIGGRVAKTSPSTGVNQFCHVGRKLFKHTEFWARRRSEDGFWDVMHPAWDGTTNIQTEETIPRQSQGNARIRDSQVRIRLQTDWLPPNGTSIQNVGLVSGYYWKTVPIEDGGVAGRPYVYMIANANCDDVIGS